MSAVPQPERHRHYAANSLLAKTLADQARRRAQRERARGGGGEETREIPYPWVARDGREVDILVLFAVGSRPTFLSAEVRFIDDRVPTPAERREYERQFASEMEAAGDLWEDVASYVWER